MTRTLSETSPVRPAVYPPPGVIEPPDGRSSADQTYPALLPPDAVNVRLAPGARVGAFCPTTRPPPTDTSAVATLPSASCTDTVSTRAPVAPATYAPLVGSMVGAPDSALVIDHVNVPLPPLAENATLPLGGAVGCAGTIDTPGPTWMATVAALPSESVARTMSVRLPVMPAVYVLPVTLAPDGLSSRLSVKFVPVPPARTSTSASRGATSWAPEMLTPGPTVTVTVAVLPTSSVAVIASCVLPVSPAAYAPLPRTMLPPDCATTLHVTLP